MAGGYMKALTDEERKNLCAELRNPHERDFDTFDRAAAEIDRLDKIVKYLAQKVAGPYGITADEIKAAEEQLSWRL
jgi:hypothetical protein